MDRYKVSILVPVFNMEKYLRQSLYSITNQSLDDIQIICINDGSTDGSLEILEDFAKNDNRIEIISKSNSGYGHSMNLGLEAAKGEYVGIVEPDDFVDQDMFKTLYELAETHDADVVKCNFYSHADGMAVEDDVFVEYLEGCDYDTLLIPRRYDPIFLTAPSTCTAVYRRSLLEENHVRYLETPGASFQDTFFNYQILALANSMYLTREAFHHYRINEGSSVLSPGKIFCVCEEYDAIWKHAEGYPEVYDDLKYRIPRAQYGTYLWNLERLAPKVQYRFYERFVETFEKLNAKNLLNEEFFDEYTWGRLHDMLSNPQLYFAENYGPVNVDKSVLVLASSAALKSLGNVAAILKGVLPPDSEVFFQPDASNGSNVSVGPDIIDMDPRFHEIGSISTRGAICGIRLEDFRGSEITLVHLRRNLSTKKSLAAFAELLAKSMQSNQRFMSDEIALGSWKRDALQKSGLPIWEPLLFADYYSNELPEMPSPVQEWLVNADGCAGCANLPDAREMNDSFVKLYDYALTQIPETNYEARKSYFALFSKLWKLVQFEYDCLNYDDRLQFGEKPSPSQCPELVYRTSIALDTDRASINVIIPVYNVAEYLSECLDSVLKQDVDGLHVICVNDASTDSSLDILERYSDSHDNVTVVSQFNGGAGSARNRGIELSRSEYLAFIDPDDYYTDNTALRALLNAAQENNAKICGGSVELFKPDGSIQRFHGGEQFFYRMSQEGFQKFTDKETDYGWIRFLYHETIFGQGGVRFPERRWYEDPVFLTRVMAYCDDFYAVPRLVYEYRVDHKENSWNVVKVRDMLKGIAENMAFAKERSLSRLYSTLVLRLNRDYLDAIMEFITDEEVFTSLADIQGNLELSLVHMAQENGWKSYLIKPLYDLINQQDTAIVRFAKRAQNTAAYHLLQNVRSRFN